MADDKTLVKRLTSWLSALDRDLYADEAKNLCDAIDRIEALTAENERLKGIFESANAAASQRTVERDAATRRIEALEAALRQLAENKLSDGNCASVDVAGRRVAAIARRALGADQ